MERVCALCQHKGECDRDLAAGTSAEHYQGYCLNAPTIEQLGQSAGEQMKISRSAWIHISLAILIAVAALFLIRLHNAGGISAPLPSSRSGSRSGGIA